MGTKFLVFGSLNFDHVYTMDHFVQPGETESAVSFQENCGGKGFNQAIALARAGADVYMAGRIGNDGCAFLDFLRKEKIDIDHVCQDSDMPTGKAIIQVANGQNCILLYAGANKHIQAEQADQTLKHFKKGDWLILQNEISSVALIMKAGKERGMKIILNASPMNEALKKASLDMVDVFMVNETEGAQLAGISENDHMKILKSLQQKYPKAEIVMTVGKDGSYDLYGNEIEFQKAFHVTAVDTTAAGDTFTGFYLKKIADGASRQDALFTASTAAAIAVQKHGAAVSIPGQNEVEKAEKQFRNIQSL